MCMWNSGKNRNGQTVKVPTRKLVGGSVFQKNDVLCFEANIDARSSSCKDSEKASIEGARHHLDTQMSRREGALHGY